MTMCHEEIITVSRKRLAELLKAERELLALHAGGVDNWEYYSDSLRDAGFYNGDEEE